MLSRVKMLYGKMMFCKTLKRAVHIIIGFIVGFLLTTELRSLNYETFKRDIILQLCSSYQNARFTAGEHASHALHVAEQSADIDRSFKVVRYLSALTAPKKQRHLLLVGVMTAKQFIDTRAVTIFRTWAQDLNGHIIFFSSSNSSSLSEKIPLVALPNVDDSYPPQKKSFLMFKFMHNFFGDKYKFFMRADDDVFVNVAKMNQFLRKLNSSKAIFIGQTGVGNKEEFGQLNLNLHENFCMGGPGIIMSHVTLSHLSDNIGSCLKNLYSTHEDVEIGRCVRKHAGVSCTWSYDMQDLFFHNPSIQHSIQNDSFPEKQLYNAITVHPIKKIDAMQKLYRYYKAIEYQEIQFEMTKVYRQINSNLKLSSASNETLKSLFNFENQSKLYQYITEIKQNGLNISLNVVNSPLTTDSTATWKFFAQKIYSERANNPKKHIDPHILQAFNVNMQRIMTSINRQSIRNARILDYHSLHYGYIKFDATVGIQYIYDLLLIYRKYQGKRMTIPIRRHAHAVQTFSQTRIQLCPYAEGIDRLLVNVVVPLAGRFSIFKRFADNFEQVYSQDSHISLTVVLFPDASRNETAHQEYNLSKQILLQLSRRYELKVNMLEINGTFSRGVAFQKSLSLFDDDALLFFLDVDMHFTNGVLHRIRRNTVLREQVYFPIVFSQYSNKVSNREANRGVSENLYIDDLEGYWRQFGFGIAAIYKCDLISVGGYDIHINGWGMEDVSLYDRFVASNLTIFRAVDPGLLHIYHEIHCDSRLSPVQFEMCLGTKLSSFDSMIELSQFVNANNLLR